MENGQSEDTRPSIDTKMVVEAAGKQGGVDTSTQGAADDAYELNVTHYDAQARRTMRRKSMNVWRCNYTENRDPLGPGGTSLYQSTRNFKAVLML